MNTQSIIKHIITPNKPIFVDITSKASVKKVSKSSAGYILGTGRGFGCIRCAANKNGRCAFMIQSDNIIDLGGCCNLWTTSINGKQHLLAKLNRKTMGYIKTPPGSTKFYCSECRYWQIGKCAVVEGNIKATASCNLWLPKTR